MRRVARVAGLGDRSLSAGDVAGHQETLLRVAGVAALGGRSHLSKRQGAVAVVTAGDAVAGGNPRAGMCGRGRFGWQALLRRAVLGAPARVHASGGSSQCARRQEALHRVEPLSGRKTQRGPRSGRFQGGRGAHPGWTVGVALNRVADSYVAHRDLD